MVIVIVCIIVAFFALTYLFAFFIIPRYIRKTVHNTVYLPLNKFLHSIEAKIPESKPTAVWEARRSEFGSSHISVSPLTIMEYPNTLVLQAPSLFLNDLPVPIEFVSYRSDDYLIIDIPQSALIPDNFSIFLSRDPGLSPKRIRNSLAGCPATKYETATRKWQFRCPKCNRTVNLWLAGWIRYKGAGNPRKLRFCPRCNRSTWHIVEKTT